MQVPHFLARGLDLSGLFAATINVDLAPHSFTIRRAAHTFRDVEWTDVHGPETFSFLHCRLLLPAENGPRSGTDGTVPMYDGWIYYPHPETKPMHRQPDSVLELLMPYVPGLGEADHVRLGLNPDEISVE